LFTPERGAAFVTIGVVTKNRPDSLRECLASLTLLGDSLAEVIVIDDTSDIPVEDTLEHLPSAVTKKLRLIRQTQHEGYIVARNRIVREASTDYVLLMDDDAWLLDGRSVLDGIALLAAHPQVGAVAFAMAAADGSAWPLNIQPAPVVYACHVPCFIGFAHLLRRDVFLRLGGYRESFHFYGEEKDYCLRLLEAGLDVVYMPAGRVVHAAHIAGRSHSKYVRHTIRNDCLGALYNEPFPLPLVSVPLRLCRYVQMRGSHADPGGFRWIVKDLVKRLPSVLRERRPVRWSTLRRWRGLRRQWPAWATGSDSACARRGGEPRRANDCRRHHQLQSE
jgi:GT2 family glycosyltransferase